MLFKLPKDNFRCLSKNRRKPSYVRHFRVIHTSDPRITAHNPSSFLKRDRFLSLLASPKANRQSRSPRFSFFKYSIVQITDRKFPSQILSRPISFQVQPDEASKPVGRFFRTVGPAAAPPRRSVRRLIDPIPPNRQQPTTKKMTFLLSDWFCLLSYAACRNVKG